MDRLLSGGGVGGGGGGGGGGVGGVNDIIRALPSAPHPSLPVGARLLNFVEAWSAITQDSWALSILRKGYRIPFAREPPLLLSPILFPVAQQHLNHLREEVQILLEKKAVEIVRDTTSPGFYSRIFLVKKKTGRFSSHYRPIIAQQNDEGRSLSNGNCGLHSESYSSRGLGGFYRLYGRIPPYSYSSSVSQVPEIFPRRHYIPISGASIRNLNSAFRFYKLDGDCSGTYSISRTQHSPIFRRLACPLSFAGVPTVRPFTSLGNHWV